MCFELQNFFFFFTQRDIAWTLELILVGRRTNCDSVRADASANAQPFVQKVGRWAHQCRCAKFLPRLADVKECDHFLLPVRQDAMCL
jgi:hypothetical protein